MCATAIHPSDPTRVPCRRHNDLHALLLQLPDGVLSIIVRYMGKLTRRLCSKLQSVYGSPGSTLSPPEPLMATRDKVATLAALRSVVQSWRYPDGVKHLVLRTFGGCCTHKNATMDALTCATFVEALPNLQDIGCHSITPALDQAGSRVERITPHTALTSVHLQEAPADVSSIATYAPNLRALSIGTFSWPERMHMMTAGVCVWQGVLALQHLQNLDLELFTCQLIDDPGFCTAMRQLTALTHLGLVLADARWTSIPACQVQRFFANLAIPPFLSSLKIMGFRSLGGALGPLLQVCTPSACVPDHST
jgi:hypothetical protein